jgi:pimeloyl-ACP methyl ester carboxylesterase
MTQTIATPDGRTLHVHADGDPDGLPVVVHHGTPMAGLSYAPHVELAREQGIRLIGYDRPGYGGSSRHPGRTITDCVADVHAIADALALDRFASWGISGGGPHALTCAALCDERLTSVASLAAVAPYGADGLDWLAGMGEGNHVEFGKTIEGEASLRPFLEEEAAGMREATGGGVAASMITLLGPEDQAVLSDGLADYFVECWQHGFQPGVDGWLDDDVAFAEPWGFGVESIERPVLLLHGDDDRFVPVSHGHWLAARIPGVEARIRPDDGHITLLERRMRDVNEWLLAHS